MAGATNEWWLSQSPRSAALAIWILFFSGFFLTMNLGGTNWPTMYRLAQHGLKATATVTDLVPNDHAGCHYTYSVGGHRYEGFAEGCEGPRGLAARIGDPLSIIYLSAEPSASVTFSSPGAQLLGEVLASIIVPTLGALATGYDAARRRRRDHGLYGSPLDRLRWLR